MTCRDRPLFAKAVLFDVDGTLFDSRDAFYFLIEDLFSQAGWVLPERGRIVGLIGLTNEDIATNLIPPKIQNPEVVRRWSARAEKLWIGKYLPRYVKLYPGVYSVLKSLKDRGFKLGVATNGSSTEIPLYLEQGHVTRFMDVVVTANDVRHPKPHPEPLLTACERIRVEPSSCVYVGDTKMDAESSRAAGMSCVLMTWGVGKVEELNEFGHCALVDSFEELAGLLKPADAREDSS